ncbi:hypothetical protein EYF80_012021 [Liparis tanakae]|uniref:Uncharacterized protein n=1 Tax=Liparis tanakae TaxID=230148 RepID=A0A4Z2IKL2_9TELE|nr:hypothetical protein EYF80_012021 [Liparis tanakae]
MNFVHFFQRDCHLQDTDKRYLFTGEVDVIANISRHNDLGEAQLAGHHRAAVHQVHPANSHDLTDQVLVPKVLVKTNRKKNRERRKEKNHKYAVQVGIRATRRKEELEDIRLDVTIVIPNHLVQLQDPGVESRRYPSDFLDLDRISDLEGKLRVSVADKIPLDQAPRDSVHGVTACIGPGGTADTKRSTRFSSGAETWLVVCGSVTTAIEDGAEATATPWTTRVGAL